MISPFFAAFERASTNTYGLSDPVDIVIHVNNVVDEKPILSNSTASINENSGVNTVVGYISFTSKGDSDITVISLGGTGEGNFTIETKAHFLLLCIEIL